MDELEIQKSIKKRQFYYFQGREYEKRNQPEKAIKSYLDYSGALSSEDQHIPHQWISKLYEKLGDKESSFIHLELFANGSTDARKSEIYKEIGEKYELLERYEKALEYFQKATAINNQIGLKTKISKLQEKLK